MGGITMNHSRRIMQTHLNVKNHCLLNLFAPLFLSFTLELCAFICNQTSFQNIYTNLNYHLFVQCRDKTHQPLFTSQIIGYLNSIIIIIMVTALVFAHNNRPTTRLAVKWDKD